MSRSVAVTVTGTAIASSERAFDTIVPVDLSRVFRGYGPLLPLVAILWEV